MPYDQDRYNSLISRAAFDCSFYKGTIQDQSPARRAMIFVGSPSFCLINGLPALRQNAAGSGAQSAAIPQILDLSGTVSIEAVYRPILRAGGYHPLIAQSSGAAADGFMFEDDPVTGDAYFLLFNGGAIARQIRATTPVTRGFLSHAIITSGNGAATGSAWVGGIPTSVVLGGAGAAVNTAGAVVAVAGAPTVWSGSNGLQDTVLIRAYPFALTNSDAACLYGAAKSLIGEV